MAVLTPDQVADHAYAAGFRGDALVAAIAIARAESGFDSAAVGDTKIETATWGPSIGLWQVRSLKAERGTGKTRDRDRLTSPAFNARSAYEISRGGSNFRPWSVYTSGAYRKYLVASAAPAAAAAKRRAAGAGNAGDWGATGGGNWDGSPIDAPASSPDPGAVDADTDEPGALAAARRDPEPLNEPGPDTLDPLWAEGGDPIRLSLRGRRLEGDPAEYVAAGTVDLTTSEASQIDVTFDDPDLALLSGGLLLTGSDADWGELPMVVAVHDTLEGPGGPQLHASLRPRGVNRLKRQRPAPTRANITPGGYLALAAGDAGMRAGPMEGAAERATIAPNVDESTGEAESTWEVIARLAGEEGWWVWEATNELVAGRPSWLINRLREFTVYWRAPDGMAAYEPIATPVCRRSVDAGEGATVEVQLPRWRGEQVRPGMRLNLFGVPAFRGSYIVTGVSWNLDTALTPATIRAEAPIDPKPSADDANRDPAAAAAGTAAAGAPAAGTGSALDFVDLALRQAGDRYTFGAEAAPSDPDPAAFDCSELVEWALARVGVKFVDGAAAQYSTCRAAGTLITVDAAARTRGALLFRIGNNGNHVAISLGDGANTIEARGRAYGVVQAPIAGRTWTAAAKVPALNYGATPGLAAGPAKPNASARVRVQ